MKATPFALAGALLLTLLIPTSTAEPPRCSDEPYYTSPAWVDVDPYYVAADLYAPEGIGNVFLYEESNGIAGLQRSDTGRDDTCGNIDSDSLLYSLDPGYDALQFVVEAIVEELDGGWYEVGQCALGPLNNALFNHDNEYECLGEYDIEDGDS